MFSLSVSLLLCLCFYLFLHKYRFRSVVTLKSDEIEIHHSRVPLPKSPKYYPNQWNYIFRINRAIYIFNVYWVRLNSDQMQLHGSNYFLLLRRVFSRSSDKRSDAEMYSRKSQLLDNQEDRFTFPL